MLHELSCLNVANADALTVNEFWNVLENVLVNTIDFVAPLKAVKMSTKSHSSELPKYLKEKITKRKRLLHYNKTNVCTLRIPEIKLLNKEINFYFQNRRASRVKQAALGPKVNIWKAVKLAKNVCHSEIPQCMTLGGVGVPPANVANAFASFFNEKVVVNSSKASCKDNVYNGKCKLLVQTRNFMSPSDVSACLNDLISKKCEGFDRIPLCLLYDCRAALLPPLTILFQKIYVTGFIPDQWKVSKIVPLLKKGNRDEIENYLH